MKEIQEELRGHRLEVVAAETGLSYATVRRYASGVVINPPLESMQLLDEWLDRQGSREVVGRSA